MTTDGPAKFTATYYGMPIGDWNSYGQPIQWAADATADAAQVCVTPHRKADQPSIEDMAAAARVLDSVPDPTCDLCGYMQAADGLDWNGDTGNHVSCEQALR